MKNASAHDLLRLHGRVVIVLRDRHGTLVDYRQIPNLVVNAGKVALMAGSKFTDFQFVGIGTGTNPAQATDTVLQSEVGIRIRALLGYFSGGMTRRWSVVFGENNPQTLQNITEAGIFNAKVGGTLLARTTFGAISKAPDQVLEIAWDISWA